MYTTKCFIGQQGCCPGLTCQPIDNRGTTQCLESTKYLTSTGCVQTNQNGCSSRKDCCNPYAVCSRYRNCVLNSTCTYNYIPPEPSSRPTKQPTIQPLLHPHSGPTSQPKKQPSPQPSCQPVKFPTIQPSKQPVQMPANRPTVQPSRQPSKQPVQMPVNCPTTQPTGQPSEQPDRVPVNRPTTQPTIAPLPRPTLQPTRIPSSEPSSKPGCNPSSRPSAQPTGTPLRLPTHQPSRQPTERPKIHPTRPPINQPSLQPVRTPSKQPIEQPDARPSSQPIDKPSSHPSCFSTSSPSAPPSRNPSRQTSRQPTTTPSISPSKSPSIQPVSSPSNQPVLSPSSRPSNAPSIQRQVYPTHQPTLRPSRRPSCQPNGSPSAQPSCQPTSLPSEQSRSWPSMKPRNIPSKGPTDQPRSGPSLAPSRQPRSQPSEQPYFNPIHQPFINPTLQPTAAPSSRPTGRPSAQPSSTLALASNPPAVAAVSTHPPSAESNGQSSTQPVSNLNSNSSSTTSKAPSSVKSATPSKFSSRPLLVDKPSPRPTLSQDATYPSPQPAANANTAIPLLQPLPPRSNGPNIIQPSPSPAVTAKPVTEEGQRSPPTAESPPQILRSNSPNGVSTPTLESSTSPPTALQNILPTPAQALLPTAAPNAKKYQPAELRAALLLVNMSDNSFDISYKNALRNTLAQAISPLSANITILDNVIPIGRRSLSTNLQCTAAISISAADPQFQDILSRYITTSIESAVSSGKATTIFRSELQKAGVQNEGFPVIMAVDMYVVTAPPTMAPAAAVKNLEGGGGSNGGVSSNLLYGIVGGISVFWCMFLPFMYMMATKIRKRYKVTTYEGDKDNSGSPGSRLGESNSNDDATYYSKKFGNDDDMSFSKLYNTIGQSNADEDDSEDGDDDDDDDEVDEILPVRSFYKTSHHKAAGNISEDNISFSKIYEVNDAIQNGEKSYDDIARATTEDEIVGAKETNSKPTAGKPILLKEEADDLSISQIYATLSASLEELKIVAADKKSASSVSESSGRSESASVAEGKPITRTKYSFFDVNPTEKHAPGSRTNSPGSPAAVPGPSADSFASPGREEAMSCSESSSNKVASRVSFFSSMSTPVRFLPIVKIPETGSKEKKNRRGIYQLEDLYPDGRGEHDSDATPESSKKRASDAQHNQSEAVHDSGGKVASGVSFFSRNFNSSRLSPKSPSSITLTVAKSPEKMFFKDPKPFIDASVLDSEEEKISGNMDFFKPPPFQAGIPSNPEPAVGQSGDRSFSPLYRASPRLTKAVTGVDHQVNHLIPLPPPPPAVSMTPQEAECRSSSPLYRSSPRYGIASSAPQLKSLSSQARQPSDNASDSGTSTSTLSTSQSRKVSRTHSKPLAPSSDNNLLRSSASFYSKSSKSIKSPSTQQQQQEGGIRLSSPSLKSYRNNKNNKSDGSFRSTSPLYRNGQRGSRGSAAATASDGSGGGSTSPMTLSARQTIRSDAITTTPQREGKFSPQRSSKMPSQRVERPSSGGTQSQQDPSTSSVRSASPLYRNSPRYCSPTQQRVAVAEVRPPSEESIDSMPNLTGLLENELASPPSVKFKVIKSTFETMIQQNSKLSRNTRAFNTPT